MEPTRLGPYRVRARIGRGGMGTVYEAEDPASGAAVAVKTLATHLGDDPGLRKRFAAEIETLKSLRHPGIVRLLSFGEDDGHPYYAMELVRGRSLEQILRGGRRFTWEETVAVALEVTRALKSAHDHGVVHRDLKPANLLFADEPADGVTVKLADFGIAKLFGDAGQTHAGTIVGTAEYMAPEQAAGRSVDHRADLYSLGLVMFAMLAGRPPFRGQVAEVIDRQRREAPPRLATLVPEVPAEVDELVDRLLAKDPARRPQSALALGRLLGAIDTVHATADTSPSAGEPAPTTSPVDLDAATLEITARPAVAVIPGDATRRAVAADAMTRPGPATGPDGARATTPNQGRGPADETRQTRFTTVADLERASRQVAARAGRRELIRRAIAALATSAALMAIAVIALRPESADGLHARIMTIAGDEHADLRDARPLIDRFLERHADDARADAVRALAREIDLDALERRARRRPLAGRAPGPLERDYRAAMAREPESPTACLVALEAMLDVHAGATRDPEDDLWLALVRRQVDRLAPLAERERADDLARTEAALAEADDLARQAAATADPARRDELVARRRNLLASLVEMYGSRPHTAEAVARAREVLAEPDAP